MIGWSKVELCWSVTKQAFDNHFDFYLTGLYKKSMRRQLENFANALSDYSGGEDVDTPKDWHAAFRMLKNYLMGVCRPGKLANLILFRITMEMTRISGQTELILPCIVRGRDSRLNICV
jgi:hypothetical protein